MKWITLLLQLASFRNNLLESRVVMQNARAAAEKGKRAALFGASCMAAGIFGIAGIIIGAVELGLQGDRGEFFRFSGLLGSALGLIVFCLLIISVAALLLSGDREPPPPPEPPRSDLQAMLETAAMTFLKRILEPEAGRGPRPRSRE
jgi:hypothetical protein